MPARGVVKPCFECLCYHVACRLFQCDIDTERCLLPLHCANQVADMTCTDMAGFHLHQDPLCFAGIVVNKGDDAVNALVAAFFALPAAFLAAKWPGTDQGECPPLELIAVILCKFMRS